MNKQSQTYDLRYYAGKRWLETVCFNKSYQYCESLKKIKKESTHKLGELRIVPN